MTAPGPPGDYDVTFFARERRQQRLHRDQVPGFTLTRGLSVTAPAANPDLPARCGVNVMLILDSPARSGTTPERDGRRQGIPQALAGDGLAGGDRRLRRDGEHSRSSTRSSPPPTSPTPASSRRTSTRMTRTARRTGRTRSSAPSRPTQGRRTRRRPGVFITDGDPNTINQGGRDDPSEPDGNVDRHEALGHPGRPGQETGRVPQGPQGFRQPRLRPRRRRRCEQPTERSPPDGGVGHPEVPRGGVRQGRLHPRDQLRTTWKRR